MKLEVGSKIRYFDSKQEKYVTAYIVEIEDFLTLEGQKDGLYLTLDNDMCLHEDIVIEILENDNTKK